MEIFLAMRTWKHQTPVLYESRLVRVERAEQSDIVRDRTGRANEGALHALNAAVRGFSGDFLIASLGVVCLWCHSNLHAARQLYQQVLTTAHYKFQIGVANVTLDTVTKRPL